MISANFSIVFLLTLVLWVIYRVFLYKKNRTSNMLREVVLFLFLFYFLVMISLTIFKNSIIFTNPLKNYQYIHKGIFGIINVIPFKETIATLTDGHTPIRIPLINIFGNILVFIPLGFFIPLLFEKYNKASKVFVLGFVSTLCIELTQLFIGNNVCDIDDIIYNTTGAILGLLIFRLFEKIIENTKGKELISNIRDYSTESVFIKSGKIILAISILTVSIYVKEIYSQTASDKLSDDELIKAAFNYDIGELIKSVDFEDEKLFLVKNNEYLNVERLVRYSKSRYINNYNGGVSLKDDVGYTFNVMSKFNSDISEESVTVMVYGKNNNATSMVINLMGNEYKVELSKNDYFLAVYPEYLEVEHEEISKLYSENFDDVLSFKFFDENNIEINDIKLIKDYK